MWWWIGHVLGPDDPSGPFYLAWSGFVANLSLLGGALVIVRKHQCHVARCWRLGHHQAGAYHVCRRHHVHLDDDAPEPEDIREHLENLR